MCLYHPCIRLFSSRHVSTLFFTSYYFPRLEDRMVIHRLNVRGSLGNNIATLTHVGFVHTEDTSEGDASNPASRTTVAQMAGSLRWHVRLTDPYVWCP